MQNQAGRIKSVSRGKKTGTNAPPSQPLNFLGAPAFRRPVRSRKPELAGETPALPGTVPWFRDSKREFVRGILVLNLQDFIK
jgi:hypothetical protein